MGIFYLDHYDGDEFYACAACETHLCEPERIVSKVSALVALLICVLVAAIPWLVRKSLPFSRGVSSLFSDSIVPSEAWLSYG